MSKGLRILEVPVLLLVIAMASWDRGLLILASILTIISILRLMTNITTDKSVYRK